MQKITLKLALNEDIRRITVEKSSLCLTELEKLIRQLFVGYPVQLLKKVQLKYLDDEKDLCTICFENELQEAINVSVQSSNVLRLELDLNQNSGSTKAPKPNHQKVDASEAKPLRWGQLKKRGVVLINDPTAKNLTEAREIFTNAIKTGTNSQNRQSFFQLARIESLAGRKKISMDNLQKAIELGFRNARALKNNPALAGIRETPRFKKILATIGKKEATISRDNTKDDKGSQKITQQKSERWVVLKKRGIKLTQDPTSENLKLARAIFQKQVNTDNAEHKKKVSYFHLARIEAMSGRKKLAMDQLQNALDAGLNINWARKNAAFESIRELPRFQKMIGDSSARGGRRRNKNFTPTQSPADKNNKGSQVRWVVLKKRGVELTRNPTSDNLQIAQDIFKSQAQSETAKPAHKRQSYFHLARIESLAGRNKLAMDFIEKALEVGFKNRNQFKKNKAFDNIRDCPRFQKIIASVTEKNSPQVSDIPNLGFKLKILAEVGCSDKQKATNALISTNGNVKKAIQMLN